MSDGVPDRDRPGIERLLAAVERLRGVNGCPWDREQTLASLKPFLIEECFEAIDAVDEGDPQHHAEELGDVLLQIALHAQIRREEGAFDFDAVAHGIADKLIRRHPHVFGDVTVADSREVAANWEAIKAVERGDDDARTVLSGIPKGLPAVHMAHRIQERAARVGFDWSDVGAVLAKVREELDEVDDALRRGNAADVAEEIGDLCFAVINLARFSGIHTEDALRMAIAKFRARFEDVERRVRASGRRMTDCSLADLDALWNDVKVRKPPAASRPCGGDA